MEREPGTQRVGGTAEAPGLGGGDSTAGRKLRERMMSELLISHSCDLSTFWVITTTPGSVKVVSVFLGAC